MDGIWLLKKFCLKNSVLPVMHIALCPSILQLSLGLQGLLATHGFWQSLFIQACLGGQFELSLHPVAMKGIKTVLVLNIEKIFLLPIIKWDKVTMVKIC